MTRVLILGYGNPMRSDDGLGWQVAVELFRTNRCPELEVLPCHQLTPELAPVVSRAETVVFVDCAQGSNPGEIRCQEVLPEAGSVLLTHRLTPAALLTVSSELFGACPRAYLLSIQGENYAPGDSLSVSVSRRLGDLKTKLRQLIQEALPAATLAG